MSENRKITAPETGPRPTVAINLRLTPEEYEQVEKLAKQLQIKVATLVRHFLMQAVHLFNDQSADAYSQPDEHK